MKTGFIGLGNVGGKLAGSLLRGGAALVVHDLDADLVAAFVARGPGKTWIEMSTTDAGEVQRLGADVLSRGAAVADCPVSGGCHRADTGNISIYAGCDRTTFERILPLLVIMGRKILHTGDLGSASVLKVMTNYLATANLLTLCEALTVMKAAGMDLGTTFDAIAISSGNSFVHETESQLIRNRSIATACRISAC